MSSAFRVRRARWRDLERILEIEKASFGRQAYDRKLFADYWRKCGELFLVAWGDILTAEARRHGESRGESKSGPAFSRSRGSGAEGAEFIGFDGDSRTEVILGYMVSCIRGNTGELVSVAVHPASRRSGAASALMDSTLRRLRRRGVGRFVLIVKERNRGARRLYERYGFREVRMVPGYYEDGSDGWLMELRMRSQARSM
jgi:ribosomal protein S18 acetylase RimI-like enzyme